MNDDLATRLSRELHDHVDDMSVAPLTFEAVRGRAHAIRRTRRLAMTGVAAAAVLTIVVPLSLTLGSDPSSQQPPVTNPSRAEESPAPTPRPDGTFPLAALDAPEGDPPTTGYLSLPDDTLVTADVERQLPDGTMQLERFGDGWLAVQAGSFPASLGARVLQLDADLEIIDTVPATALVVDEAGRHAAWIEVDGDQRTLVQADPEGVLARTSVGSEAQVIGHLAGDRVVFQDFDYETGVDTFGVVGVDGEVATFDGVVRLLSASEATSQVAAMTRYPQNGPGPVCSAVIEPLTGARAFGETCDFQLRAFSPDGSLVAGTTPDSDGVGSPTLAILDAGTGEPLVEWSSGRGDRSPATVQHVAWEDDDTLLATVTEGVEQTVVRAELDGSLERVAPPVEQQNMSLSYRFPQSVWNLE